jgi:hypothetical protein
MEDKLSQYLKEFNKKENITGKIEMDIQDSVLNYLNKEETLSWEEAQRNLKIKIGDFFTVREKEKKPGDGSPYRCSLIENGFIIAQSLDKPPSLNVIITFDINQFEFLPISKQYVLLTSHPGWRGKEGFDFFEKKE